MAVARASKATPIPHSLRRERRAVAARHAAFPHFPLPVPFRSDRRHDLTAIARAPLRVCAAAVIDVILSARSSAAITISLSSAGEQVVTRLDGADAAAHLKLGDVVLSVNGREPGRTPSNWQREMDGGEERERASVLALRVRRPPSCGAALTSGANGSSSSSSSGGCAEGGGGGGGAGAPGAAGGTGTAGGSELGAADWPAGSFGGYGLAPGLFSMPCNLLALPDGDLVVADGGGCRLQIFSPEGELRRTIGERGEAPGCFNYPAGMAADGAGALYVADRGNCRVQKLRLSDGAHLATSHATGRGGGGGAGGGKVGGGGEANGEAGGGCGVDAAARHPAGAGVANGGGGRHRGSSALTDAAHGSELLNYPWGIALATGVLFASDMRGRVCALDARTLRLLCVHAPAGGLGSPHAMAVWRDELFVVDHDRHRVQAYALAPPGRRIAPPSAGRAPGMLGGGGGSSGDGDGGGGDGDGGGDGGGWEGGGEGGGEGALRPAACFFSGASRSIGGRGAAAGQFEHPIGLTVSEAGLLIVSEFTGRRVQALCARSGVPLFVLPAPSGTRLLGLCAASDRVYVGDFDIDRVHWWVGTDARALAADGVGRQPTAAPSSAAPGSATPGSASCGGGGVAAVAATAAHRAAVGGEEEDEDAFQMY